jgi:2-polyprenyl-3-methyl-5-hydroxy-6-metoxy-1,4-benzoquinol methylase
MGVVTCQCDKCQFIYSNPMPTPDALHLFYRDHYRYFYRKVRAPTSEHIKQYGLDKRAEFTAAFLIGKGLLSEGAAVLDIGCAEGSLLSAIGRQGAATSLFGVEVNPEFRDFARQNSGAAVFESLEQFGAQKKLVKLITINHVLEHVRYPVHFLKGVADLLEPGGAIYIDVPDVTRYRSLDDLHVAHIYHFSRASLKNLGAVAGLTADFVEQHDPYRHPLSVRAVFRPAKGDVALQIDSEADQGRRRIKRIDRLAPLMTFRNSRFGRLFFALPLAIRARFLSVRRASN